MLRLFIWEGNGISDAYHDDGTLVVLAESPEQARTVMLDGRAAHKALDEAYTAENRALLAEFDKTGAPRREFQRWAEDKRTHHYPDLPSVYWDGSESALEREPDRIVEIDGPKWVAFNGGGYD